MENKSSSSIILEAALSEFRKKGFSGARISDIAKIAGVNKALIYYYFANKDTLFQAVFEQIVKAANLVKCESARADLSEGEIIENCLRAIDAREKLKDMITVAFSEILRDAKKPDRLFDLVDEAVFSALGKDCMDEGVEITLESRVAMFFFLTLPELGYILLGEKWANYFDVDKEALSMIFKDIYAKMLTKAMQESFSKVEK